MDSYFEAWTSLNDHCAATQFPPPSASNGPSTSENNTTSTQSTPSNPQTPTQGCGQGTDNSTCQLNPNSTLTRQQNTTAIPPPIDCNANCTSYTDGNMVCAILVRT
jgi:hypothetical protein